MATANQRLLAAVRKAEEKDVSAVRRKCFLSYHAGDTDEVANFIEKFDSIFIPKAIGVSEDEPWVNSSDVDYVMDQIRANYLRDSTITIVLIGSCTWSRKFVDWEIYSSLRNTSASNRNGLMAVTLPSVANSSKHLPGRVDDNILGKDGDEGYARWWKYPTSGGSLRNCIEIAFDSRTSKSPDNSRARRLINSSCS